MLVYGVVLYFSIGRMSFSYGGAKHFEREIVVALQHCSTAAPQHCSTNITGSHSGENQTCCVNIGKYVDFGSSVGSVYYGMTYGMPPGNSSVSMQHIL